MNFIYVFNELDHPMCDRVRVCAETREDAEDFLRDYQGDVSRLVDQYVPVGFSPDPGVLQ